MAKRHFQLTQQQEAELRRAYSDCRDGPTRTRYQAVRLYGTGYPVKEVVDITGCSRTSLMEWCQLYRMHGVAGLIDHRRGGNSAKLSGAQIAELAQRLQQYRPADLFGADAATSDGYFWTIDDLRRVVEHWYGVVYQSRTSYQTLFARCGYSYQRPAKVYRSKSAAQIAEFEEQVEKN